MKFNIQTAAALAFTAALSGCVTMEQKPAAFDDGHSLAYNIARAGGLETGIKDASAPRIPIPDARVQHVQHRFRSRGICESNGRLV